MSEHGCHIKDRPSESGTPRRRSTDLDDLRARQEAWEMYRVVMQDGTPHAAVMAALSCYREALCVMAVRRLGARGTR